MTRASNGLNLGPLNRGVGRWIGFSLSLAGGVLLLNACSTDESLQLADGSATCAELTIVDPEDGTTLGTVEDKDGDCSNGITYDVVAKTSLADGSSYQLQIDGKKVATGVAKGSFVRFSDVEFTSGENVELVAVAMSDGGVCSSAAVSVNAKCEDLPTCSDVAFISPKDGDTLSLSDDKNSDCSDGITVDVLASSAFSNKAAYSLYIDGKKASSAVIDGNQISFPDVNMVSEGESSMMLTVSDSGRLCSTPVATITSNCTPVSGTCSITKPVITDAKPGVNGIAAPDGDRVSADSDPYAISVEILSGAGAGEKVELFVDGSTTPLSANVSGGKALFSTVALDPDGQHTLQARCYLGSAVQAESDLLNLQAISVAPAFADTSLKKAGHIFAADDVNPSLSGVQFNFCATTDTAAALDLDAAIAPNLCASAGLTSEICSAAVTGGGAPATGTGGACVQLTCPTEGENLPFSIRTTLKDSVGNLTAVIIPSLTCGPTKPAYWANWTESSTELVFDTTTDTDPGKPGWQGTLTFNSNAISAGARVLVNGANPAFGSTDGTGLATVIVDIPDGAGVEIQGVVPGTDAGGVGYTEVLTRDVATAQIPAPTSLTATVTDRRATNMSLTWPAVGGVVSDYVVKRSDTEIVTQSDFDSATTITYSGGAGSAGVDINLAVNGLYIEHDYYFAVQGIDGSGNKSPIVTAEARANFNATVLSLPAGASPRGFGVAADGTTDLNKDGIADLVVSSRNTNEVYVFLGKDTPNSFDMTTPDATITVAGLDPDPALGDAFGRSVAVVGDINGNTFPDIAISAPGYDSASGNIAGRVYLVAGRSSWSGSIDGSAGNLVTCNAADFDYLYGNCGASLAALGDSNGDNNPDFGVGAPDSYWGGLSAFGRGSMLFARSNGGAFADITWQTGTASAQSIEIIGNNSDHDVSSGVSDPGDANFGSTILSAGKFGSDTASTLVVTAGLADRIYALPGDSGTSVITVTDSTTNTSVPANPDSSRVRFGEALATLGRISGRQVLAASAPRALRPGVINEGGAYIYLNSSASSIFDAAGTITVDGQGTKGTSLGAVLIGSAARGGELQMSLVGGTEADLAIAGSIYLNTDTGNIYPGTIYIFDGGQLVSAAGTRVLATDFAVSVVPVNERTPTLTDWIGSSPFINSVGADMNNDGYPELIIGEYRGTFAPGYEGRVVILW